MPESTRAVIVLVAAQENLLNNLRGALAHTNLALLDAHSKQEASLSSREKAMFSQGNRSPTAQSVGGLTPTT